MFGQNIPIRYVRLEIQLATLTNGFFFLSDTNFTNFTGTNFYLLFMERSTAAIILSRNCYYFFNSYSRNKRGWSIVDGTFVLMKLSELFEIENIYNFKLHI